MRAYYITLHIHCSINCLTNLYKIERKKDDGNNKKKYSKRQTKTKTKQNESILPVHYNTYIV